MLFSAISLKYPINGAIPKLASIDPANIVRDTSNPTINPIPSKSGFTSVENFHL